MPPPAHRHQAGRNNPRPVRRPEGLPALPYLAIVEEALGAHLVWAEVGRGGDAVRERALQRQEVAHGAGVQPEALRRGPQCTDGGSGAERGDGTKEPLAQQLLPGVAGRV